ncbi:hypothetical protein ACN47E_006787 [Coniothyrium glycines]
MSNFSDEQWRQHLEDLLSCICDDNLTNSLQPTHDKLPRASDLPIDDSAPILPPLLPLPLALPAMSASLSPCTPLQAPRPHLATLFVVGLAWTWTISYILFIIYLKMQQGMQGPEPQRALRHQMERRRLEKDLRRMCIEYRQGKKRLDEFDARLVAGSEPGVCG